MLKVNSRSDLIPAKAAPAKPAAPEAPAPAAIEPGQVAALQKSVATIAAAVEQLPWLLANRPEPPAPPKKLEGVVQRDSIGRIEKIIVTVIS